MIYLKRPKEEVKQSKKILFKIKQDKFKLKKILINNHKYLIFSKPDLIEWLVMIIINLIKVWIINNNNKCNFVKLINKLNKDKYIKV